MIAPPSPQGAASVSKLADEINEQAGFDQVAVLDIGGGLPAVRGQRQPS